MFLSGSYIKVWVLEVVSEGPAVYPAANVSARHSL